MSSSGIRTRGLRKREEKDKAFKKLGEEGEFQREFHKDLEANETICNESFFGIYKLVSGLKED